MWLPRPTGSLQKVGDDKHLSGGEICLCVLNRASGVATIRTDVSTCGSWGLSLYLLPRPFPLSHSLWQCVFLSCGTFCLTLCFYLVELWAAVCYFIFLLHIFIWLLRTFPFNFSLAVLRLLNHFLVTVLGYDFIAERGRRKSNSRDIILTGEKKPQSIADDLALGLPWHGKLNCPRKSLTDK